MYNSTHEYEVSILVNRKPVTEVYHQARTFIEGRKNSNYELFFKNNSSSKVLVIPSVDGLSVLDGKPAGIDSPGFVVDAWGSITVPGWKVDSKKAAKFVFKPQGAENERDQTYVEAVGQDAVNQGTIGFMVFKEKVRPFNWDWHLFNGPPPSITRRYVKGMSGSSWQGSGSLNPSSGSWVNNNMQGAQLNASAAAGANVSNTMGGNSTDAPRGIAPSFETQAMYCADAAGISTFAPDPDADKSLGTGFGKATGFNTVETTFERETPTQPQAIFVFYYDSLRGLKRRGVPVERFQKSYKKSGVEANPFPKSPGLTGATGCPLPPGWKR